MSKHGKRRRKGHNHHKSDGTATPSAQYQDYIRSRSKPGKRQPFSSSNPFLAHRAPPRRLSSPTTPQYVPRQSSCTIRDTQHVRYHSRISALMAEGLQLYFLVKKYVEGVATLLKNDPNEMDWDIANAIRIECMRDSSLDERLAEVERERERERERMRELRAREYNGDPGELGETSDGSGGGSGSGNGDGNGDGDELLAALRQGPFGGPVPSRELKHERWAAE